MKLKTLLIAFLAMALSYGGYAQNESYIYLEGIKGIAYKVKLNGVLQPQLGRNYILLPIKQMGENTLDIEFGGALYPTQTYVLDIQEKSSYGYKLAKAGEDKFYLLDLVNNGKIIESNSNLNIGLSTIDNGINFFQPKPSVAIKAKEKKVVNEEATEQALEISRNERRRLREEEQQREEALLAAETAKKEEASRKEKEAREELKAKKKADKELKKQQELLAKKAAEEAAKKEEAIAKALAEEQAIKKETLGVVEVIQSKENKANESKPQASNATSTRCAKNPSNAEIASLIDRMKQKADDDSKLIILKKKIFTGCVTANQMMQIGEQFETQYGRFSAIKFMHAEMADPENIVKLEPLFRYDSYKSKLRKL